MASTGKRSAGVEPVGAGGVGDAAAAGARKRQRGEPDGSDAALAQVEGRRVVFVGGKGGVGKSTTSCALALRLARQGRKVLLISTDPAHNVSDCFEQRFSGKPTAVAGVKGLWCVETDPGASLDRLFAKAVEPGGGGGGGSTASSSSPGSRSRAQPGDLMGQLKEMLVEARDWLSNLPGVDEAVALMEILDGELAPEIEVMVIDTAPTGHTLKLLQLPALLQKGIVQLESWQGRLAQYISMAAMFFSGSQPPPVRPEEQLKSALKRLKGGVERLRDLLTDQSSATFVCVCIAEALSVLETGRLVKALGDNKIHTSLLFVNKLFPARFLDISDEDVAKADEGDLTAEALRLCRSRVRVQSAHLDKLLLEHAAHRVVRVEELPFEPRGLNRLDDFADAWRSA
jgi:arsenite-transporting ATPase